MYNPVEISDSNSKDLVKGFMEYKENTKHIIEKDRLFRQGITIKYLQEYIKSKNIDWDRKEAFIKLSEEVGELAKAILRNPDKATETSIKGTIEEEICDVISLCLIIANSYDIDVEKWIPIKEKLHNEKWNNNVVFDPR